MNISEKIEYLREQKGISLTHLNKAINAYRGKITDVRKGKASFNELEISILARELSTTTDYLLGNTDDPRLADGKREEPAKAEPGEPSEDAILFEAYKAAPENIQEAIRNLLGLK